MSPQNDADKFVGPINNNSHNILWPKRISLEYILLPIAGKVGIRVAQSIGPLSALTAAGEVWTYGFETLWWMSGRSSPLVAETLWRKLENIGPVEPRHFGGGWGGLVQRMIGRLDDYKTGPNQ